MEKVSNQVYIVIGITVFSFLFIFFIISFLIIYKKKHKKDIEEKLSLKINFQQELLKTQIEIQEQTFKNISQEIHDNIGQVLSLVKLNINTMNSAQPILLQEKINDSKHLITKAIQDLRDISKSLNTDYVTQKGLIQSIEYELELIKKTGACDVQFNLEGKPCRLQEQQELILFRMVQEILHNILKHAKATKIYVHALFSSEIFTLHITDDGIGFDTSALNENNYNSMGLGLKNMYNRAGMINTNLKLTSALGKGTEVILTLPLQSAQHKL